LEIGLEAGGIEEFLVAGEARSGRLRQGRIQKCEQQCGNYSAG
jgi:hypothetical protein